MNSYPDKAWAANTAKQQQLSERERERERKGGSSRRGESEKGSELERKVQRCKNKWSV